MSLRLTPALPVLVVDDEQEALDSTERMLRFAGINNVVCCKDSRKVMDLLAELEPSILLLDLLMPHLSGEELLPQVVETHPDIPVIVITGSNEVRKAVSCMQKGAFDYMVKPEEESRLLSGIQRAIEFRELKLENSRLSERMLSEGLDHPEAFAGIISGNKSMHAVFRYVETIAKTLRPVLITGETGVGKGLIARVLHDLSGLEGEFVAVNAAGLDDPMFSDTMFGHVRGAFTGATDSRAGLVEKAAQGTLFLDEIGDLSMQCQVRLLRLLQEREYMPLGSDVTRQAHARIIVATIHDLDALQEKGKFRRDLYYRLKTHKVHVPPLRERLDDLPTLVHHFIEEVSDSLGKKKPTLPPELFGLLATYHFPGNVRELESMIVDALSQHKSGVLSMDVFKSPVGRTRGSGQNSYGQWAAGGGDGNPFSSLRLLPSLETGTEMLIAEAMRRANGNQTLAAMLLGMSRSALNKRLNKTRASSYPKTSLCNSSLHLERRDS